MMTEKTYRHKDGHSYKKKWSPKGRSDSASSPNNPTGILLSDILDVTDQQGNKEADAIESGKRLPYISTSGTLELNRRAAAAKKKPPSKPEE